MSREKVDDVCWALSVSIIVVVFLFSLSCPVASDDPFKDNPAASEIFSQLISQSLTNFSSSFKVLSKDFAFCITNSSVSLSLCFCNTKNSTSNLLILLKYVFVEKKKYYYIYIYIYMFCFSFLISLFFTV